MAGAFEVVARIDDRQVTAALERLRTKVGNIRPAMVNIGEELLRSTQHRFHLQSGPDGGRWQALAPSTRKAKLAKGQNPRKILTGRGTLRETIRYQADNTGLRIGTTRIYGAIHQLGGQAGRGRKVSIPARPYLGISRQDRDRILGIVADFLEARP